jgi:hypothetical protein
MQKGILILWVVSFIGMLFNFLTLIYIGELAMSSWMFGSTVFKKVYNVLL